MFSEALNGGDRGTTLVAAVTADLKKETDSLFNAGMAIGSRSPGNKALEERGPQQDPGHTTLSARRENHQHKGEKKNPCLGTELRVP